MTTTATSDEATTTLPLVLRDERGQFLKGTRGGPGNPWSRRVAELKRAVYAALTPAALQEVVESMVAAAKNGDVAAAKLLLNYAIGRPGEGLVKAVDDALVDAGVADYANLTVEEMRTMLAISKKLYDVTQ